MCEAVREIEMGLWREGGREKERAEGEGRDCCVYVCVCGGINRFRGMVC